VIYPTPRAIALAAAGAPVALLLGLVRPELWAVGAAWAAFVFGLTLVDALLGADRTRLALEVDAPVVLAVSRTGAVTATARFSRGAVPRWVEAALETGHRLTAEPDRQRVPSQGGVLSAAFTLRPVRRGEGALQRLWLRWTGPLGLVWKQRAVPLDRVFPITPDLQGVQDEAIRLFSRDAMFGIKTQLETGDGSEFHALKEHQAGMDLRTVDWKQSARHGQLLAREFRTERNNPVVLALDAGRLMCEPVDGLPKIDRALNAALLLAYVGLKTGDRVGLFAFDDRVRVSSGAVSGTRSFALLQRLAAGIDYSAEEANYTLALTTLQGTLERRSLVVVFTDFADATSAELMLENAARLLKRHVVVFVLMRDAELEALARAEPLTPDDVSRAVVAGALLRERELVVLRLRRLGAEIVEAPVDRVGAELVSRYLDLRRRERL
jgi:uncharacterized protein (DUF58 family)